MGTPEHRYIIVPPSTLEKLLEMRPEAKLAWRGAFSHATYALRLLEKGETLTSSEVAQVGDAAIMTVGDFGASIMEVTKEEVIAVDMEVDIEDADDQPPTAAHAECLQSIREAWAQIARLNQRLRIPEKSMPGGQTLQDALRDIDTELLGVLSKQAMRAQEEAEVEYANSKMLGALVTMGIKRADLPSTLRGRAKLVCERAEEQDLRVAQVAYALKHARDSVSRPEWERHSYPAQIRSLADYAGHYRRAQELEGLLNTKIKEHADAVCQRDTLAQKLDDLQKHAPGLIRIHHYDEVMQMLTGVLVDCGVAGDGIPTMLRDRVWMVVEKLRAQECSKTCCTQTTKCAECGIEKHTPWRGPNGYVCVKCMGDKYDRFEGAIEQHLKLCELYTTCELALHPSLDVLAPGVKYKHHIDAVKMVADAVTATQHILLESIKKLGAADKTSEYSLQNMVSLLIKFAFDARAQRNKMAEDFNKERTACVQALAQAQKAEAKVFEAESKMHKAQSSLRPVQDELLTTQRRRAELERFVAKILGCKYEENERYDVEAAERRFNARTRPLSGYDELARVLDAALEQAQSGKGKERHGMSGDRWVDQKIHTIPQSQGHVGGLVYQVSKKALECEFMLRQGQVAQGYKEALGVVVYAAALAWQASIRVRQQGGHDFVHMFDDQKGVVAVKLTPKEHIHIQRAPETSIGDRTSDVKYVFEGVTPVPRHGAKFKRGDEVFISDGMYKGEHHKVRCAVLMGSNSKPLSWYYRMEGLGSFEVPEEHLEETPSSDIDDSSSHDGE